VKSSTVVERINIMSKTMATKKFSGSSNSLLLSDIEIGDEEFQNNSRIDGKTKL
jgi:hypothetical protein